MGFLGKRLIETGAETLAAQASWPLAAGVAGGALLFALSDLSLASAWSKLANPDGTVPTVRINAIYGKGVLAKYLPGSVFQYASRQLDGVEAGLGHGPLAKASLTEVALHFPASLGAMGIVLAITRWPWASAFVVPVVGYLITRARLPIAQAAVRQLLAFTCFAGAAMLIGSALLGSAGSIPLFAGLFLLAWLAGFLVPIAPGGLGVREAAMLLLAGSQFGQAPLLASIVALRFASVLGDLAFALAAMICKHR